MSSLSPLEIVALSAGILASVATLAAYLEQRWPTMSRLLKLSLRGRGHADFPAVSAEGAFVVLPMSNGRQIPLPEFVRHWTQFVSQNFPDLEPLSAAIPVGSQMVVYDRLKRMGLDALCREIADNRDTMQITNQFWDANGEFFERVHVQGARGLINGVKLSARAITRQQ